MDGLKKVVAFFALMVVVLAFTAPAMAQSYGYQQQPAYQGGYQQGGYQQQPAYQGGYQQQPAYQGGTQQGQQTQQGGLKESSKDLMQTLNETTDTTMFAAAVVAAGYDQMLGQKEGPFMVFAPSDKALQNAGVTDVSMLSDDAKASKKLVESCIVPKMVEPKQGSDSITMTTLDGKSIVAKKMSSGITVNGIKVDNVMKAENGLLAVTDGIIGMGKK
jgi:uncharacterized surface protein with fasciclin (FAS1) repeats